MIVCFLACVKSRRAYCPVDISVPASRVKAILDVVEPELILAVEELSVKNKNILSCQSIISIISEETRIVNKNDKESHVSEEDNF